MSDIVELLEGIKRGNRQAADDLFRLVYKDLKRLACNYIRREQPGHTLQPTALVHEVYLRLIGPRDSDSTGKPWLCEGREHFFAAAARAMRHILVESARRKKRDKRGGGWLREPLNPDRIAEPEMTDRLLELHDALIALAEIDPPVAELVNLRYFGGLTIREAAEMLGIAPRTADAHWAYARAWIHAHMLRAEGRSEE